MTKLGCQPVASRGPPSFALSRESANGGGARCRCRSSCGAGGCPAPLVPMLQRRDAGRDAPASVGGVGADSGSPRWSVASPSRRRSIGTSALDGVGSAEPGGLPMESSRPLRRRPGPILDCQRAACGDGAAIEGSANWVLRRLRAWLVREAGLSKAGRELFFSTPIGRSPPARYRRRRGYSLEAWPKHRHGEGIGREAAAEVFFETRSGPAPCSLGVAAGWEGEAPAEPTCDAPPRLPRLGRPSLSGTRSPPVQGPARQEPRPPRA